MKYTFNPSPKPVYRLPKVGECWKHSNDPTIYMRISDEIGKSYFNFEGNGSFYSVRIDSGIISHTANNSDNIVLLKEDCKFTEQ